MLSWDVAVGELRWRTAHCQDGPVACLAYAQATGVLYSGGAAGIREARPPPTTRKPPSASHLGLTLLAASHPTLRPSIACPAFVTALGAAMASAAAAAAARGGLPGVCVGPPLTPPPAPLTFRLMGQVARSETRGAAAGLGRG